MSHISTAYSVIAYYTFHEDQSNILFGSRLELPWYWKCAKSANRWCRDLDSVFKGVVEHLQNSEYLKDIIFGHLIVGFLNY